MTLPTPPTAPNKPKPGFKPDAVDGDEITVLTKRIEKLKQLIADLNARGVADPTLAEFLEEPKKRANIKLKALEDELAKLKGNDVIDDLDVEAILREIEGLSALKGGGWASRPESIAIGSTGIASRFTSTAYPTDMTVPLLWQHDPSKPVGVAKLSRRDGGLWADWTISPTAQGMDAWTLIGDGALNGQSLGFSVSKSHQDKDGVRIVDAADIQELSLVTFPADAAARIVIADGKPITLHCAPAREFASGTAIVNKDSWKKAVRDAEKWLSGDQPDTTTPVGHFDWIRNRFISDEEHAGQERSARLDKMHRALQRDPALCRMPTKELAAYLDAMD